MKFFVAFILTFVLLACKEQPSPFSEDVTRARQSLAFSMASMEAFAQQIKTAKTDDDIAAAIEQYNQALEKLIVDSKSLTQPPSRIDLKGDPEYFNDVKKKMTTSAVLFMQAYQEVRSRLDNPRISAAADIMVKKNEKIPKFTLN